MTIAEIREGIGEPGHSLFQGPTQRLIMCDGHTPKRKTVQDGEQNRDDVKKKRRRWKRTRKSIARSRLFFIDEFCVNTKMVRRFGRSRLGRRCHANVPHGHRNTTTVAAAPGPAVIIAHRTFDGAMNEDWFRAWISQLVKSLRPGDIAVCNNLAAHKVSGVRGLMRRQGCVSVSCRPTVPTSLPWNGRFH